jgi:hypothetical protein
MLISLLFIINTDEGYLAIQIYHMDRLIQYGYCSFSTSLLELNQSNFLRYFPFHLGQIRFYMSALIKIRTVSDTYPNSFNTTPNRAMGYVNLNSGSEDRFDTFVAASSVTSTSLSLLCTIDLTMSVS